MQVKSDDEKRAVARLVVQSVQGEKREKLLAWVRRLVDIRAGDGNAIAKGYAALLATIEEGAAWPVIALVGQEIKRRAWDERGLQWRAGLGAAIVGLLLASSSGAGIAALGGAIGVPLWLVLGAGGSFLAMLYEELMSSRSAPEQHIPSAGAMPKTGEVIDVVAEVIQPPSVAPSLISQPLTLIRVGDGIRCSACGNQREVTQSWLDLLSRRYTPTAAGRLTTLDATVLRKLKCSVCGAKSLVLELKTEVDDPVRLQLCRACGGDGGIEGRCYRCFGTGLEDQAS